MGDALTNHKTNMKNIKIHEESGTCAKIAMQIQKRWRYAKNNKAQLFLIIYDARLVHFQRSADPHQRTSFNLYTQ